MKCLENCRWWRLRILKGSFLIQSKTAAAYTMRNWKKGWRRGGKMFGRISKTDKCYWVKNHQNCPTVCFSSGGSNLLLKRFQFSRLDSVSECWLLHVKFNRTFDLWQFFFHFFNLILVLEKLNKFWSTGSQVSKKKFTN